MKKLVIITNLLPHYQIDFLNNLVRIDPNLEITVFADINTESNLNNFTDKNCDFNVIDCPIRIIQGTGLILRPFIHNKINEISPDYIVFYANPREITLSIMMLYYRLIGKEFFVHGMFHRIGGQTLQSSMYYRYVGALAKKCFTYSRKGADILHTLGIKTSKIRIIGTAIDEKKPISHSTGIDELSLLNFKTANNLLDRKVILQVVRLSKIKKPDFLIDLAYEIKDSHKDILFILIGDGEMYQYMTDRVNQLGLSDSVWLLGPIYDENILSYWFKVADVFVMPTCIGLSAHHSFAYSLPIITDNNLIEQASEFDILAHGLNSLIYKTGDINSLKENIFKIIYDKNFREILSKNALHTVKYVHNLDTKCKNYLNALYS